MSRWHILSIGKTDISLHPAMILYAAYALLTGHGGFMTAAMLSILLHEGAHAAAASWLGRPPRSIEITPLGAVMRLEDENCLSPLLRTVILLAGPAMTLLLCYAAVMLTNCGVVSMDHGRMLFLSNLSILLLNLIPALPLDGGRLLSVLIGLFMPIHVVNRVMRVIGSLLGLGMVVLNLYASWRLGGWNLSLAFAGCSLLYSAVTATTTQAMAELRWFMDRRIAMERKGSRHTVVIAANHTKTLRQLVRLLPTRAMAIFLCVEVGSMKPLGWLTENEVIHHYLSGPERRFADVLSKVENEVHNRLK